MISTCLKAFATINNVISINLIVFIKFIFIFVQLQLFKVNFQFIQGNVSDEFVPYGGRVRNREQRKTNYEMQAASDEKREARSFYSGM